MKNKKKIFSIGIVLALIVAAHFAFDTHSADATTCLGAGSGGTGICNATSSNVGQAIVVSSTVTSGGITVPIYTYKTISGGGGGSISSSSEISTNNFPFWTTVSGGLSGTSTLTVLSGNLTQSGNLDVFGIVSSTQLRSPSGTISVLHVNQLYDSSATSTQCETADSVTGLLAAGNCVISLNNLTGNVLALGTTNQIAIASDTGNLVFSIPSPLIVSDAQHTTIEATTSITDAGTLSVTGNATTNGISNTGNVTTTNETVSSTLSINTVTASGTTGYTLAGDGNNFLNLNVFGNTPGSGSTGTLQEYNTLEQNCPVGTSTTSGQGECTISQSLTNPYGLTGRVFYDHTLELYAPTFLWGDFITATQSSTLPEYVVEFTDHTNNHAQPFTITPVNSSTNNGFAINLGTSNSTLGITGTTTITGTESVTSNANVLGNFSVGTSTQNGNLYVSSAGTDVARLNRNANTNFNLLVFSTAGTDDWNFGEQNNSTNNFVVQDAANGGTVIQSIQNGTTTIGVSGTGKSIVLGVATIASTTLTVNQTTTLSAALTQSGGVVSLATTTITGNASTSGTFAIGGTLLVTGTSTFRGNVSTTIPTSTFVGTNALGILVSATSTKSIIDPSPVAGDFFPMFYTDAPINIKQVDCANFPPTVASGTTGNTFAFMLIASSSAAATSTNQLMANWMTCTSATATATTSLQNQNIPAGTFINFRVTSTLANVSSTGAYVDFKF